MSMHECVTLVKDISLRAKGSTATTHLGRDAEVVRLRATPSGTSSLES